MTTLQRYAAVGGPALAAVVFFLTARAGLDFAISATAAITVWTALWWVFEPVPIPAASLLPIALFQVLGILTPTQVGAAYGSPLILLLLGGFMLSQAMQRSGVHRRLALMMLRAFGGGGRSLVFGFMVSAAALSMWISNTATALMLLPIALAALQGIDNRRLQVAVLLGLAYACSIGSIGTPVGTPPNLVFMQVYAQTTGNEITFSSFMARGVPVVLIMVPLAGWLLTRGLGHVPTPPVERPGRWRRAEVRTLIVFGLTALLWITRKEPFGGWSAWLKLPAANDASVALLAVVVTFLVPSGDKPGERLMDWETAAGIPWGILLLFGSGICIAQAFSTSGLSELIGATVANAIVTWPLIVTIAVLCITVTFLTEITSNTATVTLLMPILAAAAASAGVDPRTIMLPAAMSASCAFMLPVATGPNAVVFSSGRLRIADMARAGISINVVGVLVITALNYLYAGWA
ncbi:MAG: SLC13 family permease [Pseudomonadota bacterium]